MKTRELFATSLMLTAFASAIFLSLAHPAFAQATGGAGTFSCVAGHATGSLYESGASCPKTMQFSNVFSFIICNMEQLSSSLMGNMFCGIITGLAPAVNAMVVLATVIFGISFTIGLTPATAREFQMFLIKICFVWGFATQSDYLIGYGYNFFINYMRDGVAIALTNAQASVAHWGVPAGTTSGASSVYASLDSIIGTMIHYLTDALANKSKVIDPADPNGGCKNAVFAALAIMAVAFPPLMYLALSLIGKLVMAFMRALYSYLYALIGIAFLMTLAPFFLSFFLFRQTRPLFDKWIGYLASFSLQIVLLFAFLSFVLSIDVSSTTSSFTSLVMRQQTTIETTSFRMPWDYCTICEFEQLDASGAPIDPSKGQAFDPAGKLQCKKFMQDTNLDGKIDPGGEIRAISPLTGMSPGESDEKNALFQYMTTGLIALTVLACIVESLLDYSASLAQTLAGGLGGSSAPQLGGGKNPSGRPTVGMPFEGNVKDFSTGFNAGFHRSGGGQDGLSATGRAFKSGAENLVTGGIRDGSYAQDEQSGIRNRLIDFITDPD